MRGRNPNSPIISVNETLKTVKEKCPLGAYMLQDYVHGLFGEWLDRIDGQFNTVLAVSEKTRPILYLTDVNKSWDENPDVVDLESWHYPSEADEPTIYLSPSTPDTEPVSAEMNVLGEDDILAQSPRQPPLLDEFDIYWQLTPTPAPVAASQVKMGLTPVMNSDEILVTYDFSPTPSYQEEPDFDNFQSWIHLINTGRK